MCPIRGMQSSAVVRWADIDDIDDEEPGLHKFCGPDMHEMRAANTECDTDDELWFPSVDPTRYAPSLFGSQGSHLPRLLPISQPLISTAGAIARAPEENRLQPSSLLAAGKAVAKHLHERDSCQGSSKFKVTKVAEALDQVDAYDPKMVVRVNGVRALGDDGVSIVARYFGQHFGSVKREVPVICQSARGQPKLSNFGFIVMSSTAEAEQILAQHILVVDGYEIEVRAYTVRHKASSLGEDNRQRLEENGDRCHRGGVRIRAQAGVARSRKPL